MPDAQNNLGSVLAAKMRLADAVAAYQEALKMRPDFPAALSNLGSALRMMGRRADAIKILQRAIQLSPNMPEPYNNLGIALREEGRLDEAIAIYKKCLTIRPNMVDTTNNLGNAYKDSGDIAETIACYGRALAINPRSRAFTATWSTPFSFTPATTMKGSSASSAGGTTFTPCPWRSRSGRTKTTDRPIANCGSDTCRPIFIRRRSRFSSPR